MNLDQFLNFHLWPNSLWLIFITLLGLVLASFINVVIYRLPLILRRDWGETHLPELSLSLPASHCPSCKTPLRWQHNLPLISWLMQLGRCVNCPAKIPLHYPLVELAGGVLALLIAWRFGANLSSLVYLGLALSLLALAVIDAQTLLLPDKITLPLIWAGLTWHWLFSSSQMFDQAFLGAVLGYLSLWSLFWVVKLLTGREGMGYGDFKLLAAIGAWLGAPALIPVVLLASVSGLLLALILKLNAKWQGQALPFGPHLVIGCLVLLIGGRELAAWLGLAAWLEITRWAF